MNNVSQIIVEAKLTKQLFVVMMADQIEMANNNTVLTWTLCLSNCT
jgi:hypothetical protein